MQLTQLQIENLRLIEQASLQFKPGINLVVGSNGAGKTTLLESIYLLSRGRSFRHREAGPLIKEGSAYFQLVCRFNDDDKKNVLGMQRSCKDLFVKLNGTAISKRSELLTKFPVIAINSEPQRLITAGPEVRRGFLDQGLFHVEHNYLSLLHQYSRALDQRNAALRRYGDDFHLWDKILSDSASEIDEYRRIYIEKLTSKVSAYLDRWNLALTLSITYSRGWPQECDLLSALKQTSEKDKKLKFSGLGIQRADLLIKSSSTKSGKHLSRGQLKMLACAFYFAQTEIAIEKSEKVPLLLFDDLSAELDSNNKASLVKTINKLFKQSILTVLSLEDLPTVDKNVNMFHVEHGELSIAE